MRLKEINVERVFNLGNYESLRVGGIAVVMPGDNDEQTCEALAAWVETRGNKMRDAAHKAYLEAKASKG